MLTANNVANERIVAWKARKGNAFTCPLCGEKVVFKKGEIKIPHFAHYEVSAATE